MSNSASTSTSSTTGNKMTTSLDNFAINEYFELRQIYDKKINEIPKFVKDKVYNDEVYFANTMNEWSDEEKNNYINTYTKPDSSKMPIITDLQKKVSLRKEMKNNIYKEACLLTMNIINKYFNIQTFDGTNEDYKNCCDNYNYCVVPLYISSNKESSDRLLNAYNKLTKTIWPSISLIKHNDPSFPNQGIDSNNDNIKDYDNTVDCYHSRNIIKQIDKSA